MKDLSKGDILHHKETDEKYIFIYTDELLENSEEVALLDGGDGEIIETNSGLDNYRKVANEDEWTTTIDAELVADSMSRSINFKHDCKNGESESDIYDAKAIKSGKIFFCDECLKNFRVEIQEYQEDLD